jgi:hypothetical protein
MNLTEIYNKVLKEFVLPKEYDDSGSEGKIYFTGKYIIKRWSLNPKSELYDKKINFIKTMIEFEHDHWNKIIEYKLNSEGSYHYIDTYSLKLNKLDMKYYPIIGAISDYINQGNLGLDDIINEDFYNEQEENILGLIDCAEKIKNFVNIKNIKIFNNLDILLQNVMQDNNGVWKFIDI